MPPTFVHHIAVKVADLARAESFYVSALGLPVLRRWPSCDGTSERSLWLDLGRGAFLALERADGEAAAKAEGAPGIHLMALGIARGEREAWERRLAQAGFPVYRRTDYTLYVRDPDGNRVGLSHWPEGF
ncbi:MAG: VOC family protein [Deltaproteobacteria bacterium]|nr:VOC family protein [Deltaproteobacteria bacterium]